MKRPQPKREQCPKCSKRGLGPPKLCGSIYARNCRYCNNNVQAFFR